MRLVKLAAFLSLWAVFFVAAVLIHLAVSLFKLTGRWKIISRLTRTFASLLRIILNIKISLEGEPGPLEGGGYFIVSNHLGYADGIVLGSLFPVAYVSKREVRRWPLIGQWTALCGTIFVDRKKREKVPVLVEEIAKKLREKTNVLVFPEGTSTNGEKLLPFQSALFAAPLRAGTTIVPVTLTYRRIDDQPLSTLNRDRVYWYGDMEFLSHFWNLLALRSIEVSVKIHPEISTSHFKNNSLSRRQLSQACYVSVSCQANLKDRRGSGLSAQRIWSD